MIRKMLFLGVAFSGLLPCAAAISVESPHCQYSVQTEWGSGFVGIVRITNASQTPVTNWSVDWVSPATESVQSIWDATITSTSLETGEKRYQVSNASWNGNLNPGQSREFGFVGAKSNPNQPASIPVVSGELCGELPNRPPVVQVIATRTGSSFNGWNAEYMFDARSSYDPDGDALAYAWRVFGPMSNGSVVGTGNFLEYTLIHGYHTVQLTVDDGRGGITSVNTGVAVLPPSSSSASSSSSNVSSSSPSMN